MRTLDVGNASRWERFRKTMAVDAEWKKRCAGLCRKYWPDACSLTMKTADELLGHTFLFQLPWDMEQTQEPVHFPEEIDWEFVPDGDNEFVFQMNRHRYWICLGQAYALTGEEKYAQEFVNQLLDWLGKEPWQQENENLTWRTLEAGLRADYWARAMALCADSAAVTDEVAESFMEGLRVHAKRLLENPRKGFSKKSNWGVMEYAGLYLLGFILENEEYLERARQYLKIALHTQVMDDGMQWEGSPMYHNEVLMAYLETLRIARIWNDVPFSEKELAIIEKMARATMLLQTPAHCQPMVGDSDDTDVRDLLSEAALLLKNGELKAGAFEHLDYESIWLFGAQGFSDYEKIAARELKGGLAVLSDSGQAVVRSGWTEDADWLYFKNGPLGGGHGHQDKLHIGLWLGGEEVLADSGRYTYKDIPERYALKAAQAHNVPMIKETEYAESVDSWIYDGLPQAFPNAVCQKGEYTFIEGAHAGYVERGITVRRRIVAVGSDIYVISDTFAGKEPEEIAQMFHFGESIRLTEEEEAMAEAELAGECEAADGGGRQEGSAQGRISGCGAECSFVMQAFAEGKAACTEIKTAPISRHYNLLRQSPCLCVSAKSGRTLTTFLIRRHGDERVRVTAEAVRNDAYQMELPAQEAEGYVIETGTRKIALVLLQHEVGNSADYNGICGVYGLGRTMVSDLNGKDSHMTILQW